MSTTVWDRRREEVRSQKSTKRADRSLTSMNGSPPSCRRNGHEKRDSDTEVPDNQCMDLFPSKLDHLHLSDHSSKGLLSPKSPARKKTCCRQPWSPVNPVTKTYLSEEEFPSLSPQNIKTRKGETPDVSKCLSETMTEQEDKQQQKSSKRRLVMSDVSNTKEPDSSPSTKPVKQILTDEHRLRQRQKQIDFGKNTVSYGKYLTLIPRCKRTKFDPSTPDKFQPCSARSWSGQVKVWRRRLHMYDTFQSREEFIKAHGLTGLTKSDSDTDSTTSSDANKMDIDDDNVSSRSGSACDFDEIFSAFDLDASLVDDGLPL